MSRSATATKKDLKVRYSDAQRDDVVRSFFEPRLAETDLGIIAVEQQYLNELRESLERVHAIRICHRAKDVNIAF